VLLLISLIRAVNSNLDSDLTALNLLSVHLSNSLLLKFLRSQSDETEATTLAGLATSLKLLDHESGNRSESNLGRRGLIGLEELNELVLSQVVRQVSNHDLGLGRNSVSGRTALTALTLRASLGLGLIGGRCSGCGGSIISGSNSLSSFALLLLGTLTTSAGGAASTATATTAATSRSSAARALSTRAITVSTL
jgi:hypothetical protein